METRYGRLTVLHSVTLKGGILRCRCDCGVEKDIKRHNLESGSTKSCGCRKAEAWREAVTTHGEVKQVDGKRVPSPEYRTWQNIRNRCLNPKTSDYKYYGGRGITIHPDWDNFPGFLKSMGRRPSPKHTIDREDSDGPYSEANCRWATRETQARNRAYATVRAWEIAEKLGLSKWTVYHMMWEVRAKDRGNTKHFSLSPENEARIRAFMSPNK
jgi:hypothetical protein